MFDAARRDLEQNNDFQLVQGIDRPCGENAARPISSTEKEKIASRGQRVLNGLSGARVLTWAESAPERPTNTESLKKCIWFNAELIP
jgi:hypothetical protein